MNMATATTSLGPNRTRIKMVNLTGRGVYQKGQTSKTPSKPVRASAQGQDCQMRLVGCQNDTATVVLCHSRRGGFGGTGVKPMDFWAYYGCNHCHSNEERLATFEDLYMAIGRTQVLLHLQGLLEMK